MSDWSTVVVETATGRLRGERSPALSIFRGVPFAAPPVGRLRLRPPAPVAPWVETRDALVFGPVAPQLPSMLDAMFGGERPEQSEDCLTANVWTPACDSGNRPVMVWIHGGAFTTGAGSIGWYDGSAFATNGDVVVVNFNYRLGALGFLYLDDLAGERFAGSGNLGLLDQIAALEWVRDNISSFGGDPGNVTIFGESAGGAAVVALMTAPSARGLFHRAIAQSASFTQLRSRQRAAEAAAEVLAELGVTIDGLADVPVDALVEATGRIEGTGADGFSAFGPTPDGAVLAERYDVALAGGASSTVPLILGTNRDEMHLFTAFSPASQAMTESELLGHARRILGDDAESVVAGYHAANPEATPGRVASSIATDHSFRIPAVRVGESRAQLGAPTWMYLFRWQSPAFGGVFGACHGLEIPFVFANLHQPGAELITGDSPEAGPLSAELHRRWLAFGRDGSVEWPTYDIDQRPTMVFDAQGAVEKDPQRALRILWPESGPGSN